MIKIDTKPSYNSLSEFVQHNNFEAVATEVFNKVFLNKDHQITVDQVYDNTCGEIDCDDHIIEAIITHLGDNYILHSVETNNDVSFNIVEKGLSDRARENAEELVATLKCALADLEGVMPEVEPSGDREHSGWKTIEDIKNILNKLK